MTCPPGRADAVQNFDRGDKKMETKRDRSCYRSDCAKNCFGNTCRLCSDDAREECKRDENSHYARRDYMEDGTKNI